MKESKDFTAYPISHDQKHEIITKLGGTCPCDPAKVRNQYLNNWYLDYSNTDYARNYVQPN